MNPIRGGNTEWFPVLVVDDCRMTRRLLSMYLRDDGFDVILAENGIEALEKLGRDHCGLVITDLNMPQMDGVEFTRELRNHPLFQHIPVIMLTTQGEDRERQEALEAGAAVFLTKPISQEALRREIDQVWPRENRNQHPSPV